MTKLEKSLNEWREQLSEAQFRVCRLGETEMPGSGAYYRCDKPGIYHCVCCGAPLFDAETKYDSGSGWPSYWQPVNSDAIRALVDNSHGMQRIEVRCADCDAHLGHVFEDGPPPSGLRYCINSIALKLQENPSTNKTPPPENTVGTRGLSILAGVLMNERR